MYAEIQLTYKRVGHGYDGDIIAHVSPPGEDVSPEADAKFETVVHSRFKDKSFKQMLEEVCHVAEQYMSVMITLVQQAVSGDEILSHAYSMDSLLVKELMRDPGHVASLMSVEDRLIHVRDTPTSLIRAGVDTLADAFGDVVYCRADTIGSGHIECPGCGRWGASCIACGFTLAGEYQGQWFGVSVSALLASGLNRFYLPRKWNESVDH